MMFMQQSKREICILSASGTISNASLRQPATSGGNIAYEVTTSFSHFIIIILYQQDSSMFTCSVILKWMTRVFKWMTRVLF